MGRSLRGRYLAVISRPDRHDDPSYTARLLATDTWWKRVLGVQRPYRWNVRRIVEGPVLDVGCGVGRNLIHLDGRGVGVDTNQTSVEEARNRGLTAFTAAEFPGRPEAGEGAYGTVLFAHILEHMSGEEASDLVGTYLRYLRPTGRVVIIVPQEAGFRSDPTHVDPVADDVIEWVARDNGLMLERIYSFPFPRVMGRWFKHNETVGLLRRPA